MVLNLSRANATLNAPVAAAETAILVRAGAVVSVNG